MLSFRERIEELINTSPGGRRFKEMERVTGVSAKTWNNISAGRQKANQEHIEALGKAFPQYAYFTSSFSFAVDDGLTAPGQSPGGAGLCQGFASLIPFGEPSAPSDPFCLRNRA